MFFLNSSLKINNLPVYLQNTRRIESYRFALLTQLHFCHIYFAKFACDHFYFCALNLKKTKVTLTKTPDISELVNQYAGDLFKRAYFKVSNTELAKDLVQDTFLSASEKISTFRGDSTPKTWLFSILNYKIIDYYRAKAVRPYHFNNQSVSNFFTEDGDWKFDKKPQSWNDDDGHLLDDADFNAMLKQCMDALPDKWSLSIKLKFLMEKGSEEICQELGVSPTNFWQIMHRAKLQLRECIENNWFIES